MHGSADDEAAGGAAGEVEGWTIFHAEMVGETAFGEEVGRELDGGAEASADAGSTDATVEAADPFSAVDLVEAIEGTAVVMLGTDGESGGVGL